MNKRLRKSFNNRKLAGVCGGLAEYFEIDSTIIRVVFLAATIFAVGSPILIYGVLWIVMPD